MRGRGVLLLVAVCALAAAAVIVFALVAGGPSETLTSQEVASASDVTATPLSGNVRARQGADRLLQRERAGYPCGFVFPGAVPTLGCSPSTPVQMVPLFLVRDSADAIRAFIGEDPRNGCRLLWRADIQGGVFYDPCHGSLYDRQGRVVGGPSPWDLNEWAVEVRDGKVLVDPSRIITGQGSPSAGTCALPGSRPTYLPFSASSVEYAYGGGHGLRYQSADATNGLPVYFSIERDTKTASWAGQGRRVTAGSRSVELLWIGDPGVGAVAARWLEGGSGCTEHVGSLVLHSGTRAEIEDQLIRVIASLSP